MSRLTDQLDMTIVVLTGPKHSNTKLEYLVLSEETLIDIYMSRQSYISTCMCFHKEWL